MRAKRFHPNTSLIREAAKILPHARLELMRWFSQQARDLPWRTPVIKSGGRSGKNRFMRRDPYAVWVAEIMLQQTQVATVTPYFEKWMKRFPDVASLAKASESEIMRFWAGLGYYSRARNLHRAARMILEQGGYPATAEGWKALPGIGPYTSGAIASLAFDLPEPILDGNIVRVFSRMFGVNFLPQDGREQNDAYWSLAKIWAQGIHPGEANEGLMELGALVCRPLAPSCETCPLSYKCMARKQGWQNVLPPVKQRQQAETIHGIALVLQNRNRVLFELRTSGAFLAGHQLFPLFLGKESQHWDKSFAKRFPGLKWKSSPVESGTIKHAIMNRRYVLRVFIGNIHGGPSVKIAGAGGMTFLWIPQQKLEATLTNSLARKIWVAGKD